MPHASTQYNTQIQNAYINNKMKQVADASQYMK